MLISLDIDNFAIIDHLDINFENGLNIITGQTGAGKSILLGALGLLSGDKADTSTLLNPEKNCVIEASFKINSYGLQDFFEKNELDYSDTITIRRLIAPTGKHRAFVDDQPVTQTTLKELSEKLIDIHSQHQSLLLSHRDFQTKIIDSVAGQLELVDQYKILYNSLKIKEKERAKLKVEQEAKAKQRDYLQFSVDQIDELKIQQGELEELENELSMLTHAADITESLSMVHGLADEPDQGFMALLYKALNEVSHIKKHYPPLEEFHQRLNSCYIELKDLDSDCCDMIEKVEVNPARREMLEKRIDIINSLFHKHSISTEEELVALKDGMENELWQMTISDNRLDDLAREIKLLTTTITDKSTQLTAGRKKAIPTIERHTIEMMKSLGIKDANFIIELTSCQLDVMGADQVRFLFSANAVAQPQPIEKVASGGEISRLMLALKGLVSKSVSLPTVIFDEIDTGVSGSIADKMGEIISQMSKTMQVINITHLPQVASKGEHHYYVYKDSGTHIIKLSPQERVERIAEMLSGANITDAARTQAKELLAQQTN